MTPHATAGWSALGRTHVARNARVDRRGFAFAVGAVIWTVALITAVPTADAVAARLAVTAAPNPATPLPGTTGTIDFTLQNAGDAIAYRIETRLVSVDPRIQIIPTGTVELGALGKGDKTTLSPFTYHVPADSPPGVYPAQFRFEYRYDDGATQFVSLTVTANLIVRSPPALHVGPLAPDRLTPGTDPVLELTLLNRGENVVTTIDGSWTDASGSLTPLGQGNEVFVRSLGVNEDRQIPIQIAVPAATPAGLYPIEFEFTYRDAAGNLIASDTTFSLRVESAIDLSVALDEWEADEVTISVSNIGLGTASAVEIRLDSDGPIQVRPAAAVFLGNLKPGDHTTATFAPAEPTEPDRATARAPLAVHVAYTDTEGVRQSATYDLELGATPTTDDGASPITLTVVLLIVLAAGAVGYRTYRRRRKR